MALLNENFLKLKQSYLFAKIAAEKEKFISNNKDKKLIDLSIGDVTLPLTNTCIDGIDKAKRILSSKETFTGYPPSSGHLFLKNEIIKNDYENLGCQLKVDELFISDSSKSDISNILDVFSNEITVAIQDPVYPVYVDSNLMRDNKILLFDDFSNLPKEHIDILYICSPNNPTGKVLSKETLTTLVNYALENDSIIFFDGAYESYIESPDTVNSIYEIPNAKKVAVEFRSYSKTAGLTSLRLAYSIIPMEINLKTNSNDLISLNSLVKRLKDTKYNGPSFLSEYAIYNSYIQDGKKELRKNIEYYKKNTRMLSDAFKGNGLPINSPYVWLKCRDNMSSWDYFYYLLENYGIIGTPGAGFGNNGEGYFRLTGFSSYEDTLEVIQRLKKKDIL